MRSPLRLLLLLASTWLAGCGADQSITGLRLELKPDLSGTLSSACLHIATDAGPLAGKTTGVTLDQHAGLACARGTFAVLSNVKVADLTFGAGTSPDGLGWVRVTLPRGEQALWPSVFTPPRAERERVEQTFDPRREWAAAAANVRIEIELPGNVVSHGATPKARGVSSEAVGKRATLVVPADRAFDGTEAFEWHVTWKP